MRVRPQRSADRRPRTDRRAHPIGRQTGEPERGEPREPEHGEPQESAEPDRALTAVRRHRAFVAPEDRALYTCQCGMQFEADVSTSVVCPHCGTAQAW